MFLKDFTKKWFLLVWYSFFFLAYKADKGNILYLLTVLLSDMLIKQLKKDDYSTFTWVLDTSGE